MKRKKSKSAVRSGTAETDGIPNTSTKKPRVSPPQSDTTLPQHPQTNGMSSIVARIAEDPASVSWDGLVDLGLSAREIGKLSKKLSIPVETPETREKQIPVSVSRAPVAESEKTNHNLGNLVVVDSTKNALASLCLTLASASPVLIQGPVGCGKSSIVREVARNCGRVAPPRLYVVQISEQTDSRVLLGTYRCTDIPGQFVWQPGILTLAATKGAWLLLEDLDCGPSDVHSILRPLLEWRKLFIPGRGDMVDAHKNFRIFATRRISGKSSFFSGHGGQSSWANIEKLFVKIMVQPHPATELKAIVETRFPSLKTVSSRLLSVYLLMSSETGQHVNDLDEAHDFGELNQKIASGRLFSTRDFMKWCERISSQFDVQSDATAMRVFQEALECFCYSLPTMEKRLPVAEAIGARLNIPKPKVEFVLCVNKPGLHYQAGGAALTVGRVTLPRMSSNNADSILRKERPVYSLTKPAGRLLESVTACVYRSEPVLLVGETGVGKTASVQFLARETGHKLTVVNINQQSDAMDLLGGYKPLEIKHTIRPVREEFEDLFFLTFDAEKNANFLHYVSSCFLTERWSDLVALMSHPVQPAIRKLNQKASTENQALIGRWEKLDARVKHLNTQLKRLDSNASLAFAFVEGSLVRAVKNGEWILLDEINLATAETLDCLAGIIEDFGREDGGPILLEAEDSVVKRHPDFRLFACMNPATDVGKRDLPPGIRNRFTEFFVEELTDSIDLKVLVGEYLRNRSVTMGQLDGIVKFYLAVRANAASGKLRDGTGQRPHYSLRSLCRALSIARDNPCQNVLRSLFEAFSLAFLTQLDRASQEAVEKFIVQDILGQKNVKPILGRGLSQPEVQAVEVEGYWITVGVDSPIVDERYVLTQTVKANLRQLARIVSLSKLPVLLQGETSVGKTSLITHLARITGNRVVRVNNHEHTDVQEYLGSYAADEKTGKLVFREGAVVTAMRSGAWVILDELNLAPTEVLEALNRVLDDNREIFIPETQETVRAHPKFLLFATQNPPGGIYGGRKMLSRAFRNRFLELHFSQIPSDELEIILEQRSKVPLSYAKRMVAAMNDLQVRRRGSGVFFGKQGFMTLRDLFRWADRYRMADAELEGATFHDWDQHLADEGYLLLGGRVRKEEERSVIREVIGKHLKRTVTDERLYTLGPDTSLVTKPVLEKLMAAKLPGFDHLVWTYDLRRLGVLAGQAAKFGEPILLVGETGCGKTTIVQYLATLFGAELRTVNCHMHSESADFLGGLRPVRVHADLDVDMDGDSHEPRAPGKLFEWVEGPLVTAMKTGEYFLADEISLADDSVLERLNSVLEPERKLFVAERGGSTESDMCVTAAPAFRIFGTMNPGGDYGKKELSPALRNRFTEIWAEQVHSPDDLMDIIEANLKIGERRLDEEAARSGVGKAAVDFLAFFKSFAATSRCVVSARDILAWVHFINRYYSLFPEDDKTLSLAYIHGALMVFVDGLGSGTTAAVNPKIVRQIRDECVDFLVQQVKAQSIDTSSVDFERYSLQVDEESKVVRLGPFAISLGTKKKRGIPKHFSFEARTPKLNAGRILRALQVGKPVLMEGSPGVGKTSLVQALAAVSGHRVIRINLSDQTDISDLFGADLPVEGGKAGEFAWRDGPLLQALRNGYWILLDELNLASQSVLEGLNACLDHRGEVYVPELGKTFKVAKQDLRLFACQNPTPEGGARKGLPKSFLNRFTQVFMEPLTGEDLREIFGKAYPEVPQAVAEKMIEFNSAIGQINPGRGGSRTTSAWEWNLRDLSRWAELASHFAASSSKSSVDSVSVTLAFNAVYLARLDSAEATNAVVSLFESTMGDVCKYMPFSGNLGVSSAEVSVGRMVVERSDRAALARGERDDQCGEFGKGKLRVLRGQLLPLETLITCVEMNWVAILVGGSGTGKTSLVRVTASLCGQNLRQMSLSSAMDTTELLGGFEQADLGRNLDSLAAEVDSRWRAALKDDLRDVTSASKERIGRYREWAQKSDACWENFKAMADLEEIGREKSSEDELEWFDKKCNALLKCIACGAEKLDGKPIFEEASAADELKAKVEDLAARAVADGSLSGGGRFEWIDSTLVEAMRAGDWILLDNVNLCSPSVLDRLNGVLEPDGVLIMTERGVVDGAVPVVKPHKNFRLFLTMDPKFGEISRAMRNRGCEVFLPSVETSLDEIDTTAILTGLGIESHETQCRLFGLHQDLLSKIPFYAKPSQFDLIHAAALTGQQLKFGIPVEKALKKSCKDVYLNSIAGLADPALTKIVSDSLDEWLTLPVPDFGWALSLTPSPTVKQLYFQPEVACIKREALALELIIRAIGREPLEFDGVHSFLGQKDVSNALQIISSPERFILPAVKAFLMRTSTTSKFPAVRTVLHQLDDLVESRKLGASESLSLVSSFGGFVQFVKSMACWLAINGDEQDRFHFDSRWEVEKVLKGEVEEETELGKMQAAVELYCMEELKAFDSIRPDSEEASPRGSFLSLVKHPSAASIKPTLKKITFNLKAFLASAGSMDLSGVHEIVADGLFFLRVFIRLLDSTPEVLGYAKTTRFLLPLLKVHWMWLLKRLVGPLKEMDQSLNFAAVDKISHLLGIDDRTMMKERHARKFRTNVGHPKLIATHDDGRFMDTRIAAARKLRPFPVPTNPAALGPWSVRLAALTSEDYSRGLAAVCNHHSTPEQPEAVGLPKILGQERESHAVAINLEELTVQQGCHFNVQLWPLLDSLVSLRSFQSGGEQAVDVWSPAKLLNSSWCEPTAVPVGAFNLGVECWVQWRPWYERQDEVELLDEADLKPKVTFGPHGGTITYSLSMIHCPPPERLPVKVTDKSQYSPVANNLPAEVTLGQCEAKLTQLETVAHGLWRNAAEVSDRSRNMRFLEAEACIDQAEKVLSAWNYDGRPEIRADSDSVVNFLLNKRQRAQEMQSACANATDRRQMVKLDAAVGDLWMAIGLLQIHKAFPAGSIDPLVKKSIKARYVRMQKEEAEHEWEVHRWLLYATSAVELNSEDENLHPVLKRLAKIRSKAEIEIEDAVRPEDADFHTLANEIAAYVETIASFQSVSGLANKLNDIREEVYGALHQPKMSKKDFDSKISTLVGHVKAWRMSQAAFAQRSVDAYSWFPDIGFVFYSGALQLMRGADLLIETVLAVHSTFVLARDHGLHPDPSMAMVGPWSSLDLGGPLVGFADNVGPARWIEAVVGAMRTGLGPVEGHSWMTSYAKSSLLKSFLRETSCKIMTSQSRGLKYNHVQQQLQAFDACCRIFVRDWAAEQERLAQLKAEKEALFHYKTHAEEPDEDKLTEAELKEMFPDFEDFSDMREQTSLDDDGGKKPSEDEGTDRMEIDEDKSTRQWPMSNDEALFVLSMHRRVFRMAHLPWLCGEAATDNGNVDSLWLEAHVERMRASAATMQSLHHLLDCTEDSKLMGAFAVNAALRKALEAKDSDEGSPGGTDWDKPYDFYRDANLGEAVRCLPLLANLRQRADELLEDWPEHATLKQLKDICDRISSFSVRSPLIRFVNGLEMILVAAQHWEEFAHSKISLMEQLQAITKLVIRYRKLELDSWKRSMDVVIYQARVSASRWWFHLYSIAEEVTSDVWDADRNLKEELVKVARDLLENSPMGEFEPRLQLLLTFHCHLVWCATQIEKDSEKASRIMMAAKVLWNLYQFYSQLAPRIAERLVTLRKPIEKELKDFVKISRWNDLNFYALKHAVDKCHRTLHKKIKQFQKILAQPVGPYLTEAALASQEWIGPLELPVEEKEGDNQEKRKRRAKKAAAKPGGPQLVPKADVFQTAALSASKEKSGDDEASKRILETLDIQVANLSQKVAKLSKKIMASSKVGPQLVELNDFCSTIIQVSAEMGKLELTETDKEKRKKQIRHLHQHKGRALTDLLKQLTHSGLSHRLGLAHESVENETGKKLDDWVEMEPIDLEARVAQADKMESDEALKSVWSGVLQYLFRSLKRVELLRQTLDSPTDCTKQLGSGVVPKFRGFVAHLKRVVFDEAKVLSDQEVRVFALRDDVADFHRLMQGSDDSGVPVPTPFKKLKNSWHNILSELLLELKRINLALDAAPSSTAEPLSHAFVANKAAAKPEIILNNLQRSSLSLANATQSDPVVSDSKARISRLLAEISGAAEKLSSTSDRLVTPTDAQLLEEVKSVIVQSIIPSVSRVVDDFGAGVLVESLANLMLKLKDSTKTSSEVETPTDSTDLNQIEAKLAAVLREVMLGVQEVYKKTTNEDGNAEEPAEGDEKKEDEDEHAVEFEEGVITKRLGADLKTLEDSLRLKRVVEAAKELKEAIAGAAEAGNGVQLMEKLRGVTDLLEAVSRYSNLVNYHFHMRVGSLRTKAKLLSILSGLFSQLVVKGFCLPAEELEEAQSGPSDMPTKLQDLEDAGLGEGEGTKDISDKIESEDMLEDAKRPEEYEKDDADQDLQQEEGGVEMSDDFKGKMQDVEKGEEEEKGEGEDEGDEEEELDKQMGDTEQGADKLDDQIWGDDEEEEVDEEQEPKKEEKGKSSGKAGEDETVAKDPTIASDDEEEQQDEEDGEGEKKGKPKEPKLDEDEEMDDDHEDPYHANPPQYPEPEDFDMPENADEEGRQGDEGLPEDDNDEGMDEENPFDLDKLKDKQREEEEQKEGEEGEPEGLGEEDKSGEEQKEGEEEEKPGGDGEGKEDEEVPEENQKGQDTEIAELGEPEDQQKDRNEEEKQKKEEQGEEEQGEDKAVSSKDEAGEPAAQPAPSDAKGGSMDDVAPEEAQDDENAQQELGQHDKEGKEEKQGVGASEMERGTGHRAENQSARVKREAQENKEASADEPEKKKRKPGKIDDKRTLGSEEETVRKDLMNLQDQAKTQGPEDQQDAHDGDISEGFEHVEKEIADKADGQVVDAATEEQAAEKPAPTNEKVDDEEDEKAIEDVVMEEDKDEIPEALEKLQPDKADEPRKPKKDEKEDMSGKNKTADQEDREPIETPGEAVQTLGADRGPETDSWTREELVHGDPDRLDPVKLKHLLADEAYKWHQSDETKGEQEELEAEKAWRSLENEIGPLAQSLCEQLRLILEPSLAARLQGDFRSGKRLNMRKIIPYVASGFRKDRIWLRRVKPWKRHHRVIIAVDDSASMKLAGASAMAQASLALIAKSLSLLGLGENQLSVMSFGDKVRVLHPFSDTFSDASGAKILKDFSFEQVKTHISALLDAATAVFMEAGNRNPAVASAETAQLLVIVSDGRGLFYEGTEKVANAVRQARDANIFVVFVVVDNPENRDSILDIRQPQFSSDGKLLGIRSYMESFPFPFYVILRDIDALPSVLGDALRQWFELVTAPKG